jgi:dihydrofolate reductase
MKGILAVNNLGIIGKGDSIPWRCNEDLKHFKEMTMGCNCLVGRKTYESLPPLKGRNLIIVGKGYFTNIEEAINSVDKIDWVIGGKSIYEQTCHLWDELHLSAINDNTEGDVDLPDLRNFTGETFYYVFDPNK